MAKVFVFDYDRCNGCHNCQIVCKDEHCDQPWLPYAEAQPLTGQFWTKVVEDERGQVPWVRISYGVLMCNHCADAPCLSVGQGAYQRDDGLVILDPEKSKGNRAIVDACPIGAIYYNEDLDIPQKCTGCAHLLDNDWDVPRCVDACATDALFYLDESEVDKDRATLLEGLEDYAPRFYIYNKPLRFVAGSVYSLAEDELITGATVELKAADGTVIATQQTDELGDFKFDQVEPAAYTVVINGSKSLEADLTLIDLSLGDIDIA